MCGIAGLVHFDHSPVDRNQLMSMTDIMAHRGPDASGYYIDKFVGLGHRRLSIIDLEGGKQPLSNENGQIWITYNGEIYNFAAIRIELEKKGHKFKTNSDTEVIVHAYEEWGENCLQKFIGMFAFTVWDARNEKLFLARDRLGIKPLYFYFDKSIFVFASELKSFSQVPSVKKDIDSKSILQYLNYGYIQAPHTVFNGIQKLLPGHYISIKINGLKKINQIKYWDVFYEPDESITVADWKERIRDCLVDAVRMRLISDVPLGAFLSGGTDSSIVVGIMSQLQNKPVKTFSIGFEDSKFNELEYARIVAKKFQTDHHEEIVSPNAIDLLPKLVWQYDEPFGDSSAIPTYYVSKLARKFVTVTLSGDGGDELFAGYDHYRVLNRFKKLHRVPLSVRKNMIKFLTFFNNGKYEKSLVLRRLLESDDELALTLSHTLKEYEISKILSKDMLALGQSLSEIQKNSLDYLNTYKNLEVISRMQYLDTKTYLPDDILVKVDRASMLNSLEVRVPILDHRFVELVGKIPIRLKILRKERKYIFKETFKDLLPPELRYRPKMGFALPIENWFRGELSDYTQDLLFSTSSLTSDFLNTSAIQKLFMLHKNGKNYTAILWNTLFLEQWLRNWKDLK
jgi:asparagine synthase (glutamine-hydrolysing)